MATVSRKASSRRSFVKAAVAAAGIPDSVSANAPETLLTPAAWSVEQLEQELAGETDPGERCRLLLCWDTGLPLAKLHDVNLEGLLAQASAWGHTPVVSVGGREYSISQRTIEAIGEWLIADRAPDQLAKRSTKSLDLPGFRVVVLTEEPYWFAESKPMTLREVSRVLGEWSLSAGNTMCILPPAGQEGGAV